MDDKTVEKFEAWGLLELFGHQRRMMRVQLLAPEVKPAAIDGSTEAFQRDHPGAADGQGDLLDGGQEAGEAFAGAHGGPGDDDGADSEGGTTDAGKGENWPFPTGDGPGLPGEANETATDADPGAAEQAEIEAGMRESLAAAGLREKPARRGRKVAAVE